MDNLETKYGVRNFCFYFGGAYFELCQRGLITEEQLERVVNLLDKLEAYPPDLFVERLEKIFSETKN